MSGLTHKGYKKGAILPLQDSSLLVFSQLALKKRDSAWWHCLSFLYFKKISTTGISSGGGGIGSVIVTAPSTVLAVNIPDWL